MSFILFLIFIFLIFCLLYGVSSGVNLVTNGLSQKKKILEETTTIDVKLTDTAKLKQPEIPLGIQQCLSELQTLFSMYQQGALSSDEYEHLKQQLLQHSNPAA
jgi:hypothetical protein